MDEQQTLVKLREKYEIIDANLGKGGMGDVYHCIRKEDGKHVAIKVIKSSCTNVELMRFKNEIKAMRKIDSEFVVKYIDCEFNDEERWIAMEYVRGTVLKKFIQKNTPIDTELAIVIAKMIAQGLSDIHNSGIIHRDLKTSNVMIDDNNYIKIIDLGIALDEVTPRYTQTGKVIGTPEYLAPELVKKTSGPSVQSDIYAFGILLYEMLEGTSPYSGDVKSQLISHVNQPIPKLSRIGTMIPQSVQNIINKCCSKDPTDRYEDAISLWNDLDTCLNKERAFEEDPKKANSPKKKINNLLNNKVFLISLLTVGIILIGLLAVLLAIYK